MKNILQFKNKISLFQEGIDYTFKEDEGDGIYVVSNKDLKDFFWGDVSEGSEYKVVVNEMGKVISSEKIAIANSSQLVEEELWEKSSFGHFPKASTASSSYSKKDDKNKTRKQGDENIDEKFFYGLRQEIAPGETTGKIEKTVYHRRKQGESYVEDKIVMDSFDSESSETDDSSRFQEITDDVEMNDAKKVGKVKKNLSKQKRLEVEKDSNHKGGKSSNKYAKPFIFGGLFFIGLVGVVVAKIAR